MANTLLNQGGSPAIVIAREGLRIIRNNMVAGSLVHREYREEFDKKVGDTITIRKPNKFTATDGATRTNQNIVEPSTTMTINYRKHVSWAFTSKELTLTVDEYNKKYIEPAMNVLADQVDLAVLSYGQKFYNMVGTPGTVPNAFSILGDAATKLDNEGTPTADRSTVLNPAANWTMADALKGLFNESMAQSFVRKGKLGTLAGTDVYMGQNVARATLGPRGGSPLVNGASQTGTSLITDGWTASAATRVAVGDVFTIANVFAVNPVNQASTGQLRQFVVVSGSAVASDGSGNLTLTVSPAITTSGAYQTVSAGPADNAALTFLGTASTSYAANIMFHRNALGLVTLPLEMPDGVAFKSRATYDGVSVRVVKDYDIDNDEDIIRMDILFGVKEFYPEHGVRIGG